VGIADILKPIKPLLKAQQHNKELIVEAFAKCKYLRKTARKSRLVCDAIRGKMVGEALGLLEFSIKKDVSKDIAKLIKSAVSNLQNKHSDAHINVDELVIKQINVDNGPVQKRFRPRAQGRAYRILKRMCHITVVVSN
jgi:large subunit ribosomal protein L22